MSVTDTFTLEVPRMARAGVRVELRKMAAERPVSIVIEEEKGLLRAFFAVTVMADTEQGLADYILAVKAMSDERNAERGR